MESWNRRKITAGIARKHKDILKLKEKNFKVEQDDKTLDELVVWFEAPKKTIYEGGIWRVKVKLGNYYPDNPPEVTFLDKILHPNIDEQLGEVCLDVFEEMNWKRDFDLCHIFEYFLPQLLTLPNAQDSVNEYAGFSYKSAPEIFERDVVAHMKSNSQKRHDPMGKEVPITRKRKYYKYNRKYSPFVDHTGDTTSESSSSGEDGEWSEDDDDSMAVASEDSGS